MKCDFFASYFRAGVYYCFEVILGGKHALKNVTLALLLCFCPLIVKAGPLKVVNVGAPAINCIFATPCTVIIEDTKDDITLSTGGTGLLQSRTFNGLTGSPAAGLYGFEYRLDLRRAVGATKIGCIDWMTMSFGPVIGTLDFGGDAKPDQVFVVTSGGLGSIGIASAVETGGTIKFKFSSPVCEGSAPGKGDSSFFWGLVSKNPPKFVTAMLHETGGVKHILKARSPQ